MQLLLLCFWSLAALPAVQGHAFLLDPMSRNLYLNKQPYDWTKPDEAEWCPHCGQGGGPTTVKDRAGDVWPTIDAPGSHGLCGNPFQGKPVTDLANEKYMWYTNEPMATYIAGSIVEFKIGVSTHHLGHFEFRICDYKLDSSLASHEVGQNCLDTWVLERADPSVVYGNCQVDDPRGDCQPLDSNHPGRWYLPPTSYMEALDPNMPWSDDPTNHLSQYSGTLPAGSSFYRMKYKIPEDLSCTHCTLQWYWSSGNTCLYDADYVTYFTAMQNAGWSAGAWSQFAVSGNGENEVCNSNKFGEEFWNCADIAVVGSSASSTVALSTPVPGTTVVTTTPALSTAAPSTQIPATTIATTTSVPSTSVPATTTSAPVPPTTVAATTNAPSTLPAGTTTTTSTSSSTPEPEPEPEPFCCGWGKADDMCGTCSLKAFDSKWCGQSEAQCTACMGTWCTAPAPSRLLEMGDLVV